MHEVPSWVMVSQKVAGDIGYEDFIPAVVLTVLALMTVMLRWYSRVKILGTYGTEDVLVTFALFFSVAFTGSLSAEFALDLQNPGGTVKAPLLSAVMEIMFASSIFYHVAVSSARFSILFQYQRLFRIMPSVRLLICVVGTATLGALTWGILGIVFLCEPVQKFWQSSLSGKCLDMEDHFWSSSLFGVVLDCVIWLMPMPVLGTLKLQRRQKLGLLVPFGLGLFVCIVAVLRIVRVHGAAEKGNVSKSGSYAALWSTVEINVAIVCSSLLVMKPLLARVIPGLNGTREVSAQREDSTMRRVMTIAALQEHMDSLSEIEEVFPVSD